MRFATPQWLYWLLLLLPAYAALLWAERQRARRLADFAAEPLWKTLIPELVPGARGRKALLWCLALAFALLALARPQWGTHEEVAKVTGMDIMLTLDVSNSMLTEDVVPSRLLKAKHFVRSFAERLGGDRLGVVAFADSTYVACPLTNDLEYLLETVTILSPKAVASQGTDLGAALETARKALERGAEEPSVAGAAGAASAPLASKAVLLISDGEDHEETALEQARKLKESGIRLYILGVGTQKGGPIPLRDDNTNLLAYKKDRKGQPIISQFRPDALLQLASVADGRYWNLTADEAELEELLQELSLLGRADYAERRYLVYEDRFQIPLAIAVALLLLELSLSLRRKVTGVWVALLQLGLAAGALQAPAPAEARSVPLGAYEENKKGLKSFSEGKLDEAKRSFGSAQALDPSLPELEYNQGVVGLGEKDVDGAIRSFESAARRAQGQPDRDPGLAARSYFNLGAALTAKGDLGAAARSYLSALDEARKAKDTGLEKDARKNLELLMQKREEQKKQQQQQKEQEKQEQEKKDQQQQQQDQQKDEQKDSKKDPQDKPGDKPQDKPGDQKDQQDQEDGKQQEKRYKESPKRKFRSAKLSDEDAERVMAELKNREQQLQGKLKKQNGNAQHSPKDW